MSSKIFNLVSLNFTSYFTVTVVRPKKHTLFPQIQQEPLFFIIMVEKQPPKKLNSHKNKSAGKNINKPRCCSWIANAELTGCSKFLTLEMS